MTPYMEAIIKIGSVLFFVGVALIVATVKKPEIVSQDVALAFLVLGSIPTFFVCVDTVIDTAFWICRLFK